jgi:hypothetical protein
MADSFDPYREALVMETVTEWPAEFSQLDPRRRQELETKLHATPEQASQLQYVRTHTGFCRRIIVSQEDIDRVGG